MENYSHEEIQKMSMVDLMSLFMQEDKEVIQFKVAFDRVAELKGFTKAQRADKIAQLYTDLNLDGRFITSGSNMWGLKSWYPLGKAAADTEVMPKKRSKVAKKDEDEDPLDGYEEDYAELGEEKEVDSDNEAEDDLEDKTNYNGLDEVKDLADDDDYAEEEDVFREGFGIEGEEDDEEEDEY